MTKKRPSSYFLGSLLLLSTLSCSHSRLVGHYQSRKLDQYLDFEDEATEGGEGEWGDYEGDPLDPKPNEFEYDDDSTSNGKGSSGTSSGGHSWGKTDDESSGSASDGGDSESRGSTGASNSGFPGGSSGSSSGQSGGSKGSNSYSSQSGGSKGSNSYSGQSGGSREYSTNQSKGSTSHSNKEPSKNGGSNGRGSSSSSHATGGVYLQNFTEKLNVKVPLIPVLLVFLLFFFLGMLFTACQFQNNPEGVFVNCCRLSLHITACVGKV